jgi:hypothetical protein
MIDAEAIDRMLALAVIAPFDLLTESELLLVAQQTRKRTFVRGETVFAAGQVADWMIVATSGRATRAGRDLPPVIGASSILFGLPVAEDVVAGDSGLEALCLAKPQLFTLARECPDFIVGLAALDIGAPQ